MQLKTITNAADAPFAGIEFVKVDKAVTEVIIGKLRIRKGENYGKALEVLIEAPHEEAERYRLTAKLEGFAPTVTFFDSKYEADSAGATFEDKGATIAVEKVTALIDDTGKIVGVLGEPLPITVQNDELVPF